MDGFVCNRCFLTFEEETDSHVDSVTDESEIAICPGRLFPFSTVESTYSLEEVTALKAERGSLRARIQNLGSRGGVTELRSMTGQLRPHLIDYSAIPEHSFESKVNWVSVVFRINSAVATELVEIMRSAHVSLGQANEMRHLGSTLLVEEEILELRSNLDRCEKKIIAGENALAAIAAFRENQRFRVPHLSAVGCTTKHTNDYFEQQTMGVLDLWAMQAPAGMPFNETTCRNCNERVLLNRDADARNYPEHRINQVVCGNSGQKVTECDLTTALLGEKNTDVSQWDIKEMRPSTP